MGLYQRENGVWYARWTKRGKLHRRSLNTTSRREAETRFRQLTGKPLTRRPRTSKEAARRLERVEWTTKPDTFGEMCDRWAYHARHRSHMKASSVEAYMVQVRRWRERWGDLEPGDLDAEAIAEWHEERMAAPGKTSERTANATLKFEMMALRVFLRWAADKDYISRVPPIPTVNGVSRKEPRALSAPQVTALFEAAARHPRPQVRALGPVLMLGLHGGLRREEARFLAWRDVDLEAQLLRVTAKPPTFSPKSHGERTVPMNEELTDYLARLRQRHPAAEWVCLNAELRQWSLGLSKWARELFTAAGIDREYGTLHRLRHTFGTRLIEAGVDIETVRDLMGHSDISTTARYLSSTDKRKRDAVAALMANGGGHC